MATPIGRIPAAAIITAAGSGKRMGPGPKKELRLIDGVPVIRRCVDAFTAAGDLPLVVITYSGKTLDHMKRAVAGCGAEVHWVTGGETRQESVFYGLQHLEAYSPKIVLIHDGARPWISTDLIRAVVAGTIKHGACIPVIPSTDALKRINEDGEISEHVDKSTLLGAQTPQGFAFNGILTAHRSARESRRDFSDDAEAYHEAVGRVFTVDGDPANRKITYENDL